MTSTRVCQAMEIAPLTVIPYKPKPQQPFSRHAHKPLSKPPVKRPSSLFAFQAVDLVEASAKMLLGGNSLLEKEAGCEAAGRHAGSLGDEPGSGRASLTKHADMIAAANDTNDDSDPEFPSIPRLLSPEYQHKLAARLLVQGNNAVEGNRQILDDDLFGHGSTACRSQDEPIVLDSDSGSKDDHDYLCTTQTLRTVDGGQSGQGSLELEIISTPSNLSTSDDGNNIDNTSLRPAKRQRSVSPHSKPNLGDTNTLQNEEAQGGMEYIDGCCLDKSEGDDISSKRQKLTPLGGGAASDGHSGQRRHSSSVISEGGEYGPERISDDSNLADIVVSNPGVSETAPVEIQLHQQIMDADEANQEWEIREIIGKEDVDGVPHYLVEWCPTLMPKDLMGNAQELVAKFEARQARVRARLGAKREREGRLCLKQGKFGATRGPQEARRSPGRPGSNRK